MAQSPVAADSDQAEATRLDAVRIVGRRAAAAVPESTTLLDQTTIARIAATHASEAFARVPGVWISRGSGQEQLTAIRSPVLTGVGACGAFLLLEDGVPVRPTAFCNVNQLAELPTELAGGIEVLRGPGSAVHGSNALHGVIDVRPRAVEDGRDGLAWEVGPHGFGRVIAGAGDGRRWRVDAVAVDAGSFRRDEGYRQRKLLAQWQDASRPGAPRLLLSASDLDQDTAGFVRGLDAYRDDRRRDNANPEAFRRGRAMRLQGRWEWWLDDDASVSVVPYLRQDRMRFLQHFNLGQPLEENASDSAGLQLLWQRGNGWQPQFGVDLEFASGDLLQLQPRPVVGATAAQSGIRPTGRHYDYRVDTSLLAAFAQWQIDIDPRWQLHAGVRGERHAFDYDNRVADGNLREDGTPCNFGGCLFNRPADRRDDFTAASGRLGLRYAISPQQALVGRLARAFRVPQAGELYRLQRGQEVADLQPETLHGVELGWRLQRATWRASLDGYDYRKERVILRDAQGFTFSDGRTRHRGVELALGWQPDSAWSLDLELAHADQRYRFDRAAAAGEQIRRGNRIDSAPRWLGGARIGWVASRRDELELEWRHQGGYELDAANTARYPGHDLLALRWQRTLAANWSLSARILNLTDRRYAERADLAFGQFRYFPGAGRELFVALSWRAN